LWRVVRLVCISYESAVFVERAECKAKRGWVQIAQVGAFSK